MNRNVVSGIAAFALLLGAALAMNESSAYAGNCGGGLFAKLHAKKACGGGLLAKLKAAKASDCCAPAPVCEPVCTPAPEPCCEPAPVCGGKSRPKLFGRLIAKIKARKSCCAPEPTCCEPAPAPCCEPAPAPCCEPAPAPCCEPAPAPTPCCEPAPTPCCEAAPAPAPCCGDEVAAPMMAAPVMSATVGGDAGFDLAPGETLVPGSVQTVGSAEAAVEPVESASDAGDDAPPMPEPDADTNI